MSNQPTLYIDPEDWAYIKAAVSEASYREIGGLGVVELIDGYPTVRHMRLLEQKVSSGEVDWSDGAHAEYLTWLYRAVEDGGAGFEGERYGLYSWHSHGNMGVFFSGTDDDFIKRVGQTVPWMFSSVFNNKGEVKHRVDAFPTVDDIGCDLIADDDGHDRVQITWTDVKLWVSPSSDTAPTWVEMQRIQGEAEERIESLLEEKKRIEDQLDEDLKPHREAMREEAKAVQKVAKERMKVDYKEYVTSSYYSPPKTASSQRGGTSNNGTQKGSSSQGKEGGGTDVVKTNTGGNQVGFIGDPTGQYFDCFNINTKVQSRRPLKEIISHPEVLLIEDLPESVLARLTYEDRSEMVLRPLKEEYQFIGRYQ